MTIQHERPTVFAEAFRDVTGQDPTPLLVAAALMDPDTKRQIDELMGVILELREQESDANDW
jgi:hypothetical protein